MKKSELALSALMAVSGLFGKYAATGTKIDTQESDFKSVAQAVTDALNAPEDKEPLPEIVKLPEYLTEEKFNAAMQSYFEGIPKPIAPEPVQTIDQEKMVKDLTQGIVLGFGQMLAEMKAAEAAAAAAQEVPAVAG